MNLTQYIQGISKYRLKGADIESCLSRYGKEGLPLYDIRKESDFSCTFLAEPTYEPRLKALASGTCCELSRLWQKGLRRDTGRLLRRPFLLASVFLAILFSFLLHRRIFLIDIPHSPGVDSHSILRSLQNQGINVGCSAKDLDLQKLKYRLLQDVPDLAWVAVNRRGGQLSILTLPREEAPEGQSPGPAHLISCTEGIITELNVHEGMELCKVGDSVSKGQVLVSGIEDYGLYLRAVRAEGEIYGRTWHTGTVIFPSQQPQKHYTGRSESVWSIIFGRKRINLSGNSSIYGVLCDKMISTEQFRLPSCPFPLYLEHTVYLEYTLQEQPFPQGLAEELLAQSWQEQLLDSMIAGQVEQTASVCFENGGLYIFRAQSSCRELLSRALPIESPFEGEEIQWNESSTQNG